MDSEADVTVSEIDRLHSQLSRFEDMFPGYRKVKDRACARRGIPHYLIFDPYKAHCMTLWNPGPDGYRGRDTIPYGGEVTVETAIGKLVIDTSGLPVDPSVAPSAPLCGSPSAVS
ncbi:hypothetical protein OG756_22715 [Streptomyces sp. NBC_01310]|uniref:hypothetical protein n=1 Tax=Streptomyces sp. NBC_01310 TaxID=2903820 RepID=UPI0035B63B7F|nr:hypothetical protein OG756_22715 [Streptomyces sp. NBC_01310]